MHELITDNLFDVNKTNEYKLSIQLRLDGFSFLISDKNKTRILAWKSEPMKISNENLIARRLNDWISSEDLLKKPFAKVSVTVGSPKFTIIPNLFYDKNTANQTEIIFEKENTESYLENTVEKLNSKLIFTLHLSIIESINKHFSNAEIIHPVKTLIEKELNTTENNSLILYINGKTLTFLLFETSHLQVANTFTFSHNNDILYFVLTTLKQTTVNKKKLATFVGGTVNFEELKQLLSPYLKTIQPIPLHDFENISDFSDQINNSVI